MGGLCLFNHETGKFKTFPAIIDFYTNSVKAIIEDNSGYLWISGNSGLIRFDYGAGKIKKYTISDGLQDNQFIEGSCLKSKSGELFFGGYNGFNVFHPSNIKENRYIPPVLLTELKINSAKQNPGGKNSVLDKNISETEQIKLKYKQNSLIISYIALNYISSSKNKYRYKLEGFDENWVEKTEKYNSYPARIIQHEYDHLDGKLFVDYISPLRKRLLKSKLMAISKGKANAAYKIKTAK